MKIADQIVLVTGGARGVGAAAVRAFANEGARVIINWRASEDAATALAAQIGDRAVALQADVTDRAAVDAMVAAAQGHFGAPVTTVVNNTITAPPPVPDTDMVAQARRELDEVLAAHADDAEPGVPADSVDPEVAEAAEDEALARIMEQFGPGTEVVDD